VVCKLRPLGIYRKDNTIIPSIDHTHQCYGIIEIIADIRFVSSAKALIAEVSQKLGLECQPMDHLFEISKMVFLLKNRVIPMKNGEILTKENFYKIMKED